MSARLLLLSDSRADLLEKLLRAFEPVADDLAKVQSITLGLRLEDGSARTVKLLATTLENSAPAPQSTGGGGGGLPEGVVWEAFTICASGAPATRWLPTSTTDPS